MDEYLNHLYIEFKKSVGTKDDLLDNELFCNWLLERSKLVKKYAEFLEEFGLENDSIVELNKGVADSVCERLSDFGYETLAVTDYNKTFTSRVETSKRAIVIKGGVPFIGNREIRTIITQFPIEKESLDRLRKLTSNQTEVALGVYGNSLDCDKKENIKNLKLYESLLYLMEDVDVKSKYVDDGDTYMGAVISRPKEYILDKYPLIRL